MLVIIDSSVVAKWFFGEDLSTKAITVRQNWLGSKLDLLAPDLILTEVSNIIWKKQRLGLISNLEARDTRYRSTSACTTYSKLSIAAISSL